MGIDVTLVGIAAAAASAALVVELLSRGYPADHGVEPATTVPAEPRPQLMHDHTPRWMTGYGQVLVGRDQLPTFDLVTGIDALQRQLRDLAGPVLCYRPDGDTDPSIAILLWGARGAGRTLLASALAGHFDARFVHFSARFLIRRDSGTTQPHIAMIVRYAQQHTPSVLFIDDLELIAGTAVTGRMQAVAHDLLNELRRRNRRAPCVVIGALTTRDTFVPSPALVDVFHPVIHVDHPDAAARTALLGRALAARGMPYDDLDGVVAQSAGRTPAELIDLAHRACGRAQIERGPSAVVERRHFLAALNEPTSPRWVDELALERHLGAEVARLERLLADPCANVGVLLAGDPGAGKQTIARCLAASTHRNIVTVTGADALVNDAALAEKFAERVDEACKFRPSVLLIGAHQLLSPPTLRPVDPDGGVGPRVGTVATEIDRALSTPGVAVIATALRFEDVDSALRHPQRLGRLIWVSYPDRYARLKLLRRHLRGVRLRDTSPVTLADQVAGLTPAEIQLVVADAIRNAERHLVPAGPRRWPDEPVVTPHDVWRALQLIPERKAWALSS